MRTKHFAGQLQTKLYDRQFFQTQVMPDIFSAKSYSTFISNKIIFCDKVFYKNSFFGRIFDFALFDLVYLDSALLIQHF
jgi:hypothetical protein